MNKTLANAIAVSFVLHASTITMAQHGKMLNLLIPVEEMKRMQELQQQNAMAFTFVESPATQLADEQSSQKTNLISDKSTVAKDRFQGPSKGGSEAPHVDDLGGGKQIGQLAGAMRPALAKEASAPLALPKRGGQKKIMKAQRVDENAETEQLKGQERQNNPNASKSADEKEEQRVKEAYLVKIKELQEKIERAQQKIKENEQILRDREEQERTERQNQQDWEAQQEQEEPEPSPSSKGSVGFAGTDLHGISSDIQGDVDRFGEISFHASRYALGAYFKNLKRRVEEVWLPYLAFTYSGGSLFGNETVIYFKIMPDGSVKGARVLKHSGDEVLKDFCLSAVQSPSPFGPLPETFLRKTGYPYLPVVFKFNY